MRSNGATLASKLLEQAERELRAKGIVDPTLLDLSNFKQPGELIDAIDDYRVKLATQYMILMKKVGEPIGGAQQWGRSFYD